MVYSRLRLLFLPHKLRMSLVVAMVDELGLAEFRVEDVGIDGVGISGASAAHAQEARVALIQRRQNHLRTKIFQPTPLEHDVDKFVQLDLGNLTSSPLSPLPFPPCF